MKDDKIQKIIDKKIDAEKRLLNIKFKEEKKIFEKEYKKELENKGKELVIKQKQDTIKALQPYNPVTAPKKTTFKFWKNYAKDRFFSDRTILINLELLNGFHKLFLVIESEGGFLYRKKRYIFDDSSKYYIIDAKLWCYDFHEGLTIPIKRKIPIADIKKAIEESGISEVENAINPATIGRFLKAKIAEGIMKGQQLDIIFKKLMLIGVVTMVSSVLLLILFLFKTGMLQQIKIPGLN